MAIHSPQTSTDTSGPVKGSDARTTRTRLLLPVSMAFVPVTVVCAATSIPLIWQYVPFALSLVVLGLPHGALDHLVPAWLDRRNQTVRSIARVLALYAVLAGLTALLWMWAPVVAALGFVALTWFHWGQGDLYVLVAVNESRYLETTALRAAAAFVRGGLPMLVPLVCHPDTSRTVLDNTVGFFDPDAPGITLFDNAPLRTVIAVAFLAVVVALSMATRRRCRSAADRRAWWRETAEVVVLLAFFAVVPPILAVGLYFSLWHALRHFVRLEQIGTKPEASTASRVGTLARACLPTTVAALIMLIALALLLPGAHDNGGAALGVYLVLISALTVPHVVVVTYMDYRQHVWTPVRSVR